MSNTILRITIGGAHVFCAPLLDSFLVDGAVVPQSIDFLLCLRGEEVRHQILKLVQFGLAVDAFEGIEQLQLCYLSV